MVFRKICGFLGISLAAALAMQNVAVAGGLFDSCCQNRNCPPCLQHCTEGHPRIHFKCACPRPICSPCERPGWGYFQPCWVPWPFPPDWSHCPVPPPASTVIPGSNTREPRVENGIAPAPQFDVRPGL